MIVLISLFLKYNVGVGLFMLYLFLVPTYSLVFGSFAVGQNTVFLLVLVLLLIWSYNRVGTKNNAISLMLPFLIPFVSQAVLIPFHFSEMPIESQLDNFRVDLMAMFLPFAIISIIFLNKKNQALYVNLLYVAIAVSSLYTLFLLTMVGQNPYIDSIGSLLYTYDDTGQERVLEEGIRIFGYISSVYAHVTEYGVFLIFSSVFLLRQFSRDKTWVPKVLYGLVLVCVFVCGSRSVLMAEGVVVLAFLLQQRRFKIFFAVAVLLFLLSLIIQTFLPDYLLYISSIRDDALANGSSVEMRIEQFRGCIESIQNNPLFGNGYAWTGWYRNTIGRHATMLSFESCLIQILCNNGIMGIVIWSSFVSVLLRNVKKNFSGNKDIYQSAVLLLVGYFSYTFFTGDYGTFRVMMIFYALIVANELSFKSFSGNKYPQVNHSSKQMANIKV